jgi:hypothetical protein
VLAQALKLALKCKGKGLEQGSSVSPCAQSIEVPLKNVRIADEYGVDQHFHSDVRASSSGPTRDISLPKLG